jgi:iron complex outermembrane receptor protein
MKSITQLPSAFRSGRAAIVITALAVALSPALTRPAGAQSAPPPTVAAGGLEEIIVTAQKRAQNSQDVGIALSAVSGDDLNALGAVAATDVTRDMPAVVLTQPNGPSSFSLSIRGVTQNDFADHQESPAAVYVDEVYVSQMAGLAFSLFDVDRVEVLRGPQGTLFGRNATGGLANFITRKPTSEAGGFVNLTVGDYNLTRIEGAVNGRIHEGLNGRLSFQSNHYDPLFKNVVGGAADAENGNDWSVRGQLSFDLPSSGNLLLTARTSRSDVHAGSWEVLTTKNLAPGVNGLAGPTENPWGTCAGCNATGIPGGEAFTIHDNLSGFAKLKSSGLTARYARDLGGATLTVIGDYSKLRKDYAEDSDASPFTLFQFFNGSDVDQQSLEARLNGGDKKLNWTAGLYGMRINGKYFEGWQGPAFFWAQEFDSPVNPNNSNYFGIAGAWPEGTPPYFTDGGLPGTGANFPVTNGGLPATRAPYSLVTKSFAAFGQIEYRASDLIGFTLGARVTQDKKDYQYTWFPYVYYPQSTTGAITVLTRPSWAALNDYGGSRSDTLWSGKAQVDFHLSDRVLAYLSYNRGVKGGGFNAPLFPLFVSEIPKVSFKPEELTSYEAGFKSELLDRRLRFNAAAYYYDYKDYQALIYTISLNQLVVNADAKHHGAEAEVEWVPDNSWRFGLGVGYVDAVVKGVDSRGTGVRSDFVPPNAPKWSTNALVAYTLPVASGKLSFQVDGNYLSSFWFNLGNTPAVEQKGFGVANVRANWTSSTAKLDIGASLENLADQHYGVMGFDNTSINGLAQRYPGMPRWFKAHVNYKF